MSIKMLIAFVLLPTVAFCQEPLSPPEFEGAWSLYRIEISRNGVQEKSLQSRISPSFCVFADGYHFWFEDRSFIYVLGAELTARKELDDAHYLLWRPYPRSLSYRLQLRKEAGKTFLVTETTDKDGGRVQTRFRMEPIEKKLAAERIKLVLTHGRLHEQKRQFMGDSENVLTKWLASEN